MGVVLVLPNREAFSGLRLLDVGRDMGQIAQLMEVAFREELSPAGKEALRELKLMRYLAPLLWFLSRISPEFRDLFTGYVWVDEGLIVGNVTLSMDSPDARQWVISNVAVHPRYRGRGIARELVRAAIDLARRRGGELVTLQVRKANLAAQNLYRSLGFAEFDSTMESRLERMGDVVFCPPKDLKLRRARPDEWWKGYELARAAVPSRAQRLSPVLKADYELGLGRRLAAWLSDLIHCRDTYRLAVEGDEGFAALLTLRATRLRPPHRVELMVHPRYRGPLEEALVTEALSILKRYPQGQVIARVQLPHPEAVEALKRWGFVEVETVDQLGLELC